MEKIRPGRTEMMASELELLIFLKEKVSHSNSIVKELAKNIHSS